MKKVTAVLSVKFNSSHSQEKLMQVCNEDLDIFRNFISQNYESLLGGKIQEKRCRNAHHRSKNKTAQKTIYPAAKIGLKLSDIPFFFWYALLFVLLLW